MSNVRELETKLDEVFNKNAPQLPYGVKDFIYRWAPWAVLVIGILSLLSGFTLWNGARGGSPSAYYVQQVCSTYQSTSSHCTVPSIASHLGFWLWLAIITTIIQGVLYLRAFPRLREFQKSGWDLVYYAALVNVAYAIFTLFTGYDVVGHFIGSLIGAAISFYILFQVRPLYLNARQTTDDTYVQQPPHDSPQEPVTPVEPADAAAETPTSPAEAAVAETPTIKAKPRKSTAKPKTTRKKTTPKKK